MSKSLDSIRQINHSQVFITTYHSKKNLPLYKRRKIVVGSIVLIIPLLVGSLFLYNSKPAKLYAMAVGVNDGNYLAEEDYSMTRDTLETQQQVIDSKKLEEEKVRFEKEVTKTKANRLKAIVSPIVAQVISQKVVITKHGGFDKVYVKAEKKYGVPRQILAAVHYVETGQSGDTTRASHAGAQGPMQFMPKTFAAYAQDGDGDGTKSINDVDDAIFTAAKHLAANGAASGNVSGALYRYNHSYRYVNRVLEVARSMGFSG